MSVLSYTLFFSSYHWICKTMGYSSGVNEEFSLKPKIIQLLWPNLYLMELLVFNVSTMSGLEDHPVVEMG